MFFVSGFEEFMLKSTKQSSVRGLPVKNDLLNDSYYFLLQKSVDYYNQFYLNLLSIDCEKNKQEINDH